MPAEFVFALRPLLEERRRREERKRQAFARAKYACDAGSFELERLHGAVREAEAVLHGCVRAKTPARAPIGPNAGFYDARLRFLTAAILRQHDCVRRSHGDLSEARAELVIAHRERQVLEKLLKRRFDEFRAREARRDEMEIDESNASFDRLRMTRDRLRMTRDRLRMTRDKLRMTRDKLGMTRDRLGMTREG